MLVEAGPDHPDIRALPRDVIDASELTALPRRGRCPGDDDRQDSGEQNSQEDPHDPGLIDLHRLDLELRKQTRAVVGGSSDTW